MSPVDLLAEHKQSISPPDFCVRLNALVEKPGVSISDICELISQDAEMSDRLLRIANSPIFAFPAPIDSIPSSIAMIGTRGLRDLVLASSAVSAFSKIRAEHVDMRAFWRHSLMTGLLARQLGKRARLPYLEPLFVAGLLHDIGLLLMDSYYSHVDDGLECVMDDALLAQNHATLAQVLLADWDLPDNILLPVAYHHDAKEAGEFSRYAAIVQVADMASSDENAVIPDELWHVAGISMHDLNALLPQVYEQVDGLFPVFFAQAA